MSYDALRRGRYSACNQIYSITTVTCGRMCIFEDFPAARLLIAELRRLQDSRAVYSMAWVVMPDHFHWLFQLRDHLCLAQVMKQVKGRSSRQIGTYLQRKGGIWRRAYYDRSIRKEEDLKAICHYIITNPVRADLVAGVEEYPHWDCIWPVGGRMNSTLRVALQGCPQVKRNRGKRDHITVNSSVICCPVVRNSELGA